LTADEGVTLIAGLRAVGGMPIRVLVADDHALVRRGLIALFEDRQDIQVVGEAADGFEAIRLAEVIHPDAVLMDLQMPRLSGIKAIEKIKRTVPNCKVLVVTYHGDDDLVIAALSAGADGYLLKTVAPDTLVRAIHQMYQGGAPLDPAAASAIIRRMGSGVPQARGTSGLTKRQITVLKLIARGDTDQRIAEKLAVSTRTVSTHVSRILKKLGLENRTQAALYALRQGLASLDDASRGDPEQ
jgi:NarL family two-component system response regulator LiaR